MSDLQIVTGFAILLSGFLQLRCGLGALNWSIISNLAWFSSLTHLACLTMLRNHLYTHASERRWRLIAMGMLATLLVVAILSRANSWWSWIPYYASTPAICNLGCYRDPASSKDYSFWTPLVSSLIIIVAFLVRIIRLHKTLAIGIFGQARFWVGSQTQRILRVVLLWCGKSAHMTGLKRSLGYRPLLAALLTVQFAIEVSTSSFLEIVWLIIAFAWGIWSLLKYLGAPDFVIDTVDDHHGFDRVRVLGNTKGDWTFGQIISVLLLLSPIITITEYLNGAMKHYEGNPLDNCHRVSPPERLTTEQVPTLSSVSEDMNDPDSPHNNWNNHNSTLGTALIYSVVSSVVLGYMIIHETDSHLVNSANTMEGGEFSPLQGIVFFSLCVILAITGLYWVILFSIFVEVLAPKSKSCIRKTLQSINIALFVLSWRFLGYEDPNDPNSYDYHFSAKLPYIQCVVAAGVYAVGAFIFKVYGLTKRGQNGESIRTPHDLIT